MWETGAKSKQKCTVSKFGNCELPFQLLAVHVNSRYPKPTVRHMNLCLRYSSILTITSMRNVRI